MTKQPKTKHTRDELRAILLAAGREILNDEGLETGTSNLTFKRVFERVARDKGVRVTNASVIRRIWDNQADFQADVLVAIARDVGRPEAGLTVDAVAGVIAEIDLSTAAAREAALREICRVGGAAQVEALAISMNWSLWINVVAVAFSMADSDRRERMQTALDEGYREVDRFWEETYRGFADLLGLRIREPWTVAEFTRAVTALSEGSSLRRRITGSSELTKLPTGRGGELQEWTMFAVGLEALVHRYFEPDPAFVDSSV